MILRVSGVRLSRRHSNGYLRSPLAVLLPSVSTTFRRRLRQRPPLTSVIFRGGLAPRSPPTWTLVCRGAPIYLPPRLRRPTIAVRLGEKAPSPNFFRNYIKNVKSDQKIFPPSIKVAKSTGKSIPSLALDSKGKLQSIKSSNFRF